MGSELRVTSKTFGVLAKAEIIPWQFPPIKKEKSDDQI